VEKIGFKNDKPSLGTGQVTYMYVGGGGGGARYVNRVIKFTQVNLLKCIRI
jgi:hypothetical protein